jgi:hypothetical protein
MPAPGVVANAWTGGAPAQGGALHAPKAPHVHVAAQVRLLVLPSGHGADSTLPAAHSPSPPQAP